VHFNLARALLQIRAHYLQINPVISNKNCNRHFILSARLQQIYYTRELLAFLCWYYGKNAVGDYSVINFNESF